MSHSKRNWAKYNQNLINRGKISVWIDEEVLQNPFAEQIGRGRPKLRNELLVLGLTLRMVYGLSLRALQGFMTDLFQLLQVECPIPHYSLYSKRMKDLELPQISTRRPLNLLVDASGVKVYGEGEWKVKVHGASRRRSWVKLHIGVDAKSQEIVALKVTHGNVGDSKALPDLVTRCPRRPQRVIADGAYDGFPSRDYLHALGIDDLILPPSNAKHRTEPAMRNRNKIRAIIKGFGGDRLARRIAGKLLGYHRRSLVETAFSRLKRLFGDRFSSRRMPNLEVEAHLKFWILNQMAA
jgi:IS5 family transposase